jgi:hypothetical protein
MPFSSDYVSIRTRRLSALTRDYPLVEEWEEDALDRDTVPFAEIEGALAMRAWEDDKIAAGGYEPYYEEPPAVDYGDDY